MAVAEAVPPSAEVAALLAQLRDIHLPAPPPALALPGEWLAAAVLVALVGVAAGGWHLWRNRRQRAALRHLHHLEERYARDGNASALAQGLAHLLRRHAGAAFPTLPVAGLAGEAWLAFLDAHGGDGRFREGAGAILTTLPYQAGGSGAAVDAPALIALVRAWLGTNRL